MCRLRWACCVAVLCGWATTQAADQATAPLAGTPWPATDALNRPLPLHHEVGAPKEGRFVGIFYFLWLNERDNRSPHHEGPYDVARILAMDPDALKKPDSTLWGPVGRSHYWGEPLYGYYLSSDPWILRRHAHQLADAGIDTLIFDTTNAVTYRDVYMELCRVFREVRADGGTTPQIAFMVNTHAGETAQRIYDELYKPGLYPELWFRWQGKPLMICDPEQANDELRQFFTLRRAHWPFEQINTPYAWHWEATYPQAYGYTDDPNKPEQVNVSVAQNLRISDGKVTNMSDGNARGRSFRDGKIDTAPDAVLHGHNAQEQWKRALALQAPFTMVTGWNEWIAGRWQRPNQPIVFVDQYNQEHSRDIEPMKGGHGDNYYWQLVANIRRYKGAPALPPASPPITIRLQDGFDQWREVQPEFRDHAKDTLPRDFAGAGGLHYVNRTGRNDLLASKVARDATTISFHIRTREPITPHTDPAWMWLLLDTDHNPATGWQGYDFIVNRQIHDATTTWLEKHAGDWKWEKIAQVSFRAEGCELALSIPRAALGLPDNTTAVALNFKWADNIQQPGDIMEFWVNGDTAPDGRFMYPYVAE